MRRQRTPRRPCPSLPRPREQSSAAHRLRIHHARPASLSRRLDRRLLWCGRRTVVRRYRAGSARGRPRRFIRTVPRKPARDRSAADRRRARSNCLGAAQVTAASLSRSENLLAIGRFGVGYDSVNVPACTAADVALVTTVGAVDRSVAEGTICWMLALTHHVRPRTASCVREPGPRSGYIGATSRSNSGRDRDGGHRPKANRVGGRFRHAAAAGLRSVSRRAGRGADGRPTRGARRADVAPTSCRSIAR